VCASEVSDIEHSIWRAYGGDVVVWGITSREPPQNVQRYADQLGLTFPLLLDQNGAVLRTYALQAAFPTTAYPQDWIVGRDGIVLYASNRFELGSMRAILEAELGD